MQEKNWHIGSEEMRWSPEVTTVQEVSVTFGGMLQNSPSFPSGTMGRCMSHIHVVLEGWDFVLHIPHLRFVHLFGWCLL